MRRAKVEKERKEGVRDEGNKNYYRVNFKEPFFAGKTSGVPRNFFRGGGSTNSVEDRGQRERGSGGGSPLVRGSGGNCNLVQEISLHIINVS
jgi:hypothetical protein